MNSSTNIYHADTVHCTSEWSWISDHNHWSGFHLWYVIQGGATISTCDKQYNLTTDDCFLFDLSKNHICTHDPKNPLSVHAVHFSSALLTEHFPLQYHLHNQKRAGSLLATCITELTSKNSLAYLWLLPVIGEFLTLHKETPIYNEGVKRALALIKKEPLKQHSLEELCKESGYSKNQIIRLFQKDLHMTPIQYQLQLKMDLAQKQLRYSSQSIGEIAESVGIPDLSYFSRLFKQFYQMTPGEFRKRL